MKKLLLFPLMLVVLLLSAFAVQSANAQQAAKGFDSGLVEYYHGGAKASWLAGQHTKKEFATCNDCHGDTKTIDDSETVINASCINCHGTLEQMGKKSNEEINPHSSHFGIMDCTSCHSGHVTSFSYCNNCHTFEETIPFNGAKKIFETENFEAYDTTVPNRVEYADVIVIGSGGTGSTAALVATEKGAKVIVLEKMPVSGGNTMLGAGSMNAANTRFQKAKGIQDSVELMISDTMKGGRNINNPELVRVLAEQSSASIDWLDKHGARLDYFIGIGGGASVIRGHSPDGGKPVGAYILKHLKKQLKDQGVDVRLNSRVVKILTDDKGAVTGVLVKGKHTGLYEIHSKAVVLASGGFGANAAMAAKYRPDTFGMSTSNQPGATGDGLVLAGRVGADFVDLKEVQAHPSVALGTQILISEKTRGVGAILVNMEGKRFYNELLTRDKVANAILNQTGKKAYLIIDERMRDNMSMLKGYTTLGLVVEADSVEELAKKINVDVATFKQTIADYNKAIEMQKDEAFGRTDLVRPLKSPKYGAILISPGVHYTMGGVKINTEAQVINTKGKAIPNLYAGGEVTGGVHGGNRLGGNSISETISFGRIAGANAAKTAGK